MITELINAVENGAMMYDYGKPGLSGLGIRKIHRGGDVKAVIGRRLDGQ